MVSSFQDVKHMTFSGSTVVSTSKEEETGQADEMIGKLEGAGVIFSAKRGPAGAGPAISISDISARLTWK